MKHLKYPWLALLALFCGVSSAHAQFEIKGGVANQLDPRNAGAYAVVSAGAVTAIAVQNSGASYTTAPAVVIAAPAVGNTATATANISGGRVVSITVTSGGSGYTASNPPVVTIARPQVATGAASITAQFAGLGSTSATSGAVAAAVDVKARYPRANDLTNPSAPVTTVVLVRSTFGYSFASGVPRYFMGDIIERPKVSWNGQAVNESYWRAEPVRPGETFTSVMLDNLEGAAQPIVAQGSLTVVESSNGSSLVRVSSVPSTLTSGSRLLGQQVHLINGLTLTLSGNANQNISSPTTVPFSPYRPYYYSPHASRVFATQPGRVTITWVSAVPDTSKPGETVPSYKFRRETFAVSSASQQPARPMFWTEKGFNGPLVAVPSGRIVRVNPVFNSFVPGMTIEYVPVGSNINPTPGVTPAAEPRTFWYDNQNGPASLRAYNVEGRLFIEYLGPELQGGNGVHEFLGADIVDIRRVAEVETINTHLGDRLEPREGGLLAGDALLRPNLVYNLSQESKVPYGSHIRPDGVTDYFAERENVDADRITIYWMEPNDASIYTRATPPGLSLFWPKFKRNYTQTWPQSIAQYEPVNVFDTGVTEDSGVRFDASNLPQIIFQDDPAELEAEIDAATQRLLVDLSASADKTNRTLLKFSSSEGLWYVRLFIQSENALGAEEIPDPDGVGPIEAVPPVFTLNDLNADGAPDLQLTARVGERLEPPLPGLELAGYISRGTAYSPYAYIDPFEEGVETAASGGIIPVNALPGNDQLYVWWFKKVVPPSDKYTEFYVPSVAARYTLSYPSNPQELVIASGLGVENPGLTSVQAGGSIYVQNDRTAVGYNPNEEHALMLAGNAYALRTDLNRADSSQPFVLIQYTEPETALAPARPAMRVLRVVAETATYPLTYDKIAGTPIQPPMPLTALPLPLLPDGKTVRNEEVETQPDLPVGAGAPDSYRKFAFVDRKGVHWLYRGPHASDGPQPSYGMRFYYYLREGFYFPALSTQPAVGSIQPFIADVGSGNATTLTYLPKWPDDPSLPTAMQTVLGVLYTAETLTLPKEGLPQVRGQSSAQVLYQQSIANFGSSREAVTLHDPTRQKIALLEDFNLDRLPPTAATTDYAGRTYFQRLPPNLQNRFYYNAGLGSKGGLVLIGEFIDEIAGEDSLFLNQLSAQDIADLKAIVPSSDTDNKASWDNAIEGLSTVLETFRESNTVPGTYVAVPGLNRTIGATEQAVITDPDTAVDSYALSSTGKGTGYVTLFFGNGEAFTDPGDPPSMQIIKVSPELYRGDLKTLLSSNPLDEQVILRHSGDYSGQPENFEFEWRYGFADNGLAPAGDPAVDPNWIDPGGTLGSSILVGASPSAVLSNPAILMGDVYFTMRYRIAAANGNPASAWSEWMRPSLVEGWIKRVLAKITPFNQRMTDLFNNAINTDVSLLTQAGTRWEGDIALNLENINEAGLIEIYETVLNRGKAFTINSLIDFGPSNDALILAAGYLHDLYTILGNEAFADAANPTISIDDQETVTEVNTSRFSFESQVASSLDEELALLRGRDDFGVPSVEIGPAYNRLWWNYTRGIDSGEVLYAVNYNIRETAGSPTADGIVDAADAQRMFPQGHGDALGHYLTSLKGYYKILTHPYFTWIPRAEAVNILGQPVLIDYQDERKFAAASVNIARTQQQVLALLHRQAYRDDTAAGWGHLRDGRENTRTGVTRHQGFDETSSRAGQGAFFNWVVANALLPDVDPNINNMGVQVIDRTTVPELNELIGAAVSFQSGMDLANAHLNPLGLSPGAIAFDISPALHAAGQSHFEQIYERALGTLRNAKGAFDQAATMTRLLRNQENQIAAQQEAIEDQEYAMQEELTAIYGMPYAGDIGPGKTYAQGYEGPDFINWSIIDRPSDMLDATTPVNVTVKVPVEVSGFTSNITLNLVNGIVVGTTRDKTLRITPNQFMQFADVVGPGTALGRRPYTGALQEALVETYLAQVALLEARTHLLDLTHQFTKQGELLTALLASHTEQLSDQKSYGAGISVAVAAAAALGNLGVALQWASEAARDAAEAAQEALPKAVGLATDATAPARGAIKFAGFGVGSGFMVGSLASYAGSSILEGTAMGLEFEMEQELMRVAFGYEAKQAAYELELTYRELVRQHYTFTQLLTAFQEANQKVDNLRVTGEGLLLRRESLRKRAAAVINGYRTKDLTFRTFRNEALTQYRTLFDLASRYAFLAAKSYDYETGLLGSAQGAAVINRIVASRSLGDLTGGIPQSTTSTLGDAGLAGTLAQLQADFSVAEGRLGINNPDPYGTLFSLRHELYRILNDPQRSDDDALWQQILEQHIVPDVMADPDVSRYAMNIRKPDGSPVPGIILEFGSTIGHSENYFGLPGAAGDHAYSPSSFATKISSVGLVLSGYVGMDPYAVGTPGTGGPDTLHSDALRATPYVYLIPTGVDIMRAPPLGDTQQIRSWRVHDQALPLPYNLGATAFNETQFFSANDTLSEQPWILRKHQAFRPVDDPVYFYSSLPNEFTNRRLVGRSVWNSQWKIIIPAYTLLADEQEGLDRFVRSVDDIKLFLRTYSHSGN